MPPEIIIYTDGSALGNPGPGGWAVVIKLPDQPIIELSGHESFSTNNRMEMMALLSALNWLKKHPAKNNIVKIHSDSLLVIKSLTANWKKKANLDLWQKIYEILDGLPAYHSGQIYFNWVKGHAGILLNERCNILAITAAKQVKRKKPTSSSTIKVKKHFKTQLKLL